MLRIVVDARRLSAITATNAITIKDTPERITAAGQDHHRDRQGAARSDHRRRAARGESHAPARVRPADRVAAARPASTAPAEHQPAEAASRCASLSNLTQRRRAADQPAVAVLPAAEERHGDAHPRQSAAAHVGRHSGAGALRRARAGAGHDVCADRRRRRADAADHLVQLRADRRQHRHHAAHASRRCRVAGAEGRVEQHLRQGLRRPADLRQPPDQHRDSPEGRRDQHARRPDPRRRAHVAVATIPGLGDIPIIGRLFALQPQGDAGDRHHPDADAAHRAGAEPDRRGPAAVQGGT